LKITITKESFLMLAKRGLAILSISICILSIPTQSSGQESQPVRISYNVVYGQSDEPMHRADIYCPKNANTKLPGVIMIHGGAWTLGDKANDTQHAKRLASMGFIVMAINYRLAPKHVYPAQLEDCYLALEWFCNPDHQPDLDVERLGAWGYSAGGHLAGMLATKPKSNLPRLRACVVGAAPCDLTQMPKDSQLLSGFLGGTRAQFPDRYTDASPVMHVSPDDPPVFLFHGAKDLLVPQGSTVAMQRALEKHQVPVESLVVKDKSHLTTFLDKAATERSFAFLKEKLVD
jgi:acetyl esterase/lipase